MTGGTLSGSDIVESTRQVVLPLVVGRAIKPPPRPRRRLRTRLCAAPNVALVVALATGIAANWQTIVSMFFSWVILTVVVIIAVASGAGLLLGQGQCRDEDDDDARVRDALRLPRPDHHRHPTERRGQLHRSGPDVRTPGLPAPARRRRRDRSHSTKSGRAGPRHSASVVLACSCRSVTSTSTSRDGDRQAPTRAGRRGRNAADPRDRCTSAAEEHHGPSGASGRHTEL